MKKFITLSLSLIFLVGLVAFTTPKKQCKITTHKQHADEMVKPPYRYLTSFEIHNEKGTQKEVFHSFELGKDVDHQINIAGDQKIKLTIYDAQKNKVLSNDINGQLFSSVVYNPEKTEKYTFVFSFLDDDPVCAAATVAFNLKR